HAAPGDRGQLAHRIQREEGRALLLALLQVDRRDPVRRPDLLEHPVRHLRARARVEVEDDLVAHGDSIRRSRRAWTRPMRNRQRSAAVAVIPSVKGSVFVAIVEDVQKLLAARKLKREELGRWLQPKDLAFLDSPIHAHEWYDVRIYARMSELLRDVEGGGRNE